MAEPVTEVEETIPALYHHSLAVYNGMMEEAKRVEGESGIAMIVYEGKLTELVTQKLYLSVPYYTATTRALKRMGCMRQLRRGGGSAPSQWELIREPTEELWRETIGVTKKETRQKDEETTGPLAQQVRDLQRRLDEAEDKIDLIIEALPDPDEEG